MHQSSLSELTTITIKAETRLKLEILCRKEQDIDSLIEKMILLYSEKAVGL